MSTEVLIPLGGASTASSSSSSSGLTPESFGNSPPPSEAAQRPYLSSERHFKNLTRGYIVSQLRKYGFKRLSEEIRDYEDSDEESLRVLHTITDQLADERQTQFDDILYRLQLTDENLEVTYHTVVTEIFRDEVNWGRIVAFLAFSGSFAVHCAQNRMGRRVHDVVQWTESQMHGRLRSWIRERGGWRAFVDHFSDGSSLPVVDLSSLLVAGGLFAAVVAGGAFLIRKLF